MSGLKQGQANQILFTAYTKTTGVQFSGATASQVSGARSLFGIVHGTGAAVKKPLSNVPSLVRSGIFRQTIKSAEISNFDQVLIHIEANTSLILAYNGLFQVNTFDDSDLLSALTVIQSMASDAASAAAQANSRALVIQSMASDAASAAAQGNSRTLVVQSMASDAASAAAQANSRALVVQSMASDAASAAQQANSRALVNQSVVSDLYSAALLIQSLASDAASAAAQGNSRALVIQSMASDAASAAQQGNSRALVNQSAVSDLYSLLSDYNSNFNSRIPATLDTLTAVPADAPSLQAAVMFLFHAQKFTTRRNASQVTIGKSDGSTMATATVAFNAGTSTFTRGTFA